MIWVRCAHGRCLWGHLAFNIYITRYAATHLTEGFRVRAQVSRSMKTLAYHWIQKTNRLRPQPCPRPQCCRLPQPSFLLSTTVSNIAAILNIILVGYSTAANQILIFTIHTISSYAPKLTSKISFCAILASALAVCFVTAEHVHADVRYCFTMKADLIGLVGDAPTARQLVLRAIDAGQNCCSIKYLTSITRFIKAEQIETEYQISNNKQFTNLVHTHQIIYNSISLITYG